MSHEPPGQTVKIRIPFATVLVVFVSVMAFYLLKTLAPLFMTLFLGVLLAVSLDPVIGWLESRKIPRLLSIAIVSIIISGCMVAVCVTIVPKLLEQVSEFMHNLPKFKTEMLDHFSENNPIRPFIQKNVTRELLTPNAKNFAGVFAAGNMLFSGLLHFLLVFIFAVYLLVDGPRMIEWISAFFSIPVQQKISKTTHEISKVIFSYVAGQFVTSVLSFLYVFISLWILHVPNKLLLAFLAGIFDILPVLGFFIAVVPAILFAVTISGETALIVVGLYILYHAIENYLIIPAIYGNRLRVSTFVVLISLLAAGTVAGVEGAIAILPIVASYPIIEKIWLTGMVRREAVADHAQK